MSHDVHHPTSERIQAHLEGQLSPGETADLQGHLAGCARCAAEVEAWRSLFQGLGRLEPLAPSATFAEGVMRGLEAGLAGPRVAALPLAARIRGWLGGSAGATAAHPDAGRIQDWLEGILPVRQAARVRAHLDDCAPCAREAEAWSALLASLGTLPRYAPEERFAEAVLGRLGAPARAAVPLQAPAWSPVAASVALAARMGGWVRERAPRNPRAWAAAAGVLVTPAVTVALVAYTVFSHPLVTPGSLLSFLWLKTTTLAGAALQGGMGGLMESALLFRALSVLVAVRDAPVATALGLAMFSVLTVGALWVLYRNLIVPAAAGGRYAQLSV